MECGPEQDDLPSFPSVLSRSLLPEYDLSAVFAAPRGSEPLLVDSPLRWRRVRLYRIHSTSARGRFVLTGVIPFRILPEVPCRNKLVGSLGGGLTEVEPRASPRGSFFFRDRFFTRPLVAMLRSLHEPDRPTCHRASRDPAPSCNGLRSLRGNGPQRHRKAPQ